MRVIYHLVRRGTWEQSPPGPYADPSLAAEGFLHCANAGQVERVANLFFADQPDLLVLHLDAGRLGDALRDEPAAAAGAADPFPGETFPHVYAAVPRDAVLAVRPLTRGADGKWQFSP